MCKIPRLEFLESRTLLAGADGVDDDPTAMDVEEKMQDLETEKNKLCEKMQHDLYGLTLFFSFIAGTALFVALGIYFGETV
jgi:hypothetical protein